MAWLLLATAALVAVAAAALALALPGGPLALLILAHLYNIASEIMLWLVAAAWLPAPELRRATVWIFLATALGGFVAGAGRRAPARLRRRGGAARWHAGPDALRRLVAGCQQPGARPWRRGQLYADRRAGDGRHRPGRHLERPVRPPARAAAGRGLVHAHLRLGPDRVPLLRPLSAGGRPCGAPRVPGTDLRLAAAGGVRLHRAVRRACHPLGPADLAQRDLPARGAPEPAAG